MSEMIERGARAIYYGTAGDEGREGAFERDTGAGPESCRDMMRAVLIAMREPTFAMEYAGDQVAEEMARSKEMDIWGPIPNFKPQWYAAIDAALSEDKT